jgi:hypothetical protein
MNASDKNANSCRKDGRPKKKFAPQPKKPKTAKDLADIALLDDLRFGKGETKPTDLPLACVVKVISTMKVPKARNAYSMVTVMGPEKRTWRMCVKRGYVRAGRNMLFISEDAALPVALRWHNDQVCSVKDRVYNFGFGYKIRKLLPHVKHNIYRHNNGVLYPTAAFPELKHEHAGTVCAVHLCVDSAVELQAKLEAPRPKKDVLLSGKWHP